MINARLKALNKLALPMIIAQLSYASMGFIDTLLLGQLGIEPLAGGGIGAVVYQFHYVVGIGIFVATANHIAFAKGENNDTEIKRAMLSGTVLVAALSIIFGLIIWNVAPILAAFGQEEITVAYAERYLRVVVWSLPFAFGFILIRSLVLGLGDARGITAISISAALLNYPLSYALMMGEFGLPALGIVGVALGSLILACLMFICFVWMTYGKSRFKPFPFWAGWSCFSFTQLGDTLRLGVPIAVAHAMEIGLFAGAALLVGTVSVQALAAHQIALQCATVAFMVPLGISQAVSVMVGESYGAKNYSEILKLTWTGLGVGAFSATIAALLFLFVPEFLIDLFIDLEQEANAADILVLGTSILLIAALFQYVDGAQVILMGTLRGLKLGTSPTVVAMVSYWLIGFPCSYFLLQSYGAQGVWVGLGVGLAVSCILLLGLFRHQYQRLV